MVAAFRVLCFGWRCKRFLKVLWFPVLAVEFTAGRRGCNSGLHLFESRVATFRENLETWISRKIQRWSGESRGRGIFWNGKLQLLIWTFTRLGENYYHMCSANEKCLVCFPYFEAASFTGKVAWFVLSWSGDFVSAFANICILICVIVRGVNLVMWKAGLFFHSEQYPMLSSCNNIVPHLSSRWHPVPWLLKSAIHNAVFYLGTFRDEFSPKHGNFPPIIFFW